MKKLIILALIVLLSGCTILKNKVTMPDNTMIETLYIYPMFTAKAHSLTYDPTTKQFVGRFESSATSMVDTMNAMGGLVEKATEGAVKGLKGGGL